MLENSKQDSKQMTQGDRIIKERTCAHHSTGVVMWCREGLRGYVIGGMLLRVCYCFRRTGVV